MNDRFRFRAWDERTKTCFDNAMIETLAPISTWVKNGWVVEQCTGLKDKNGRLIYEGDIVENGVHNNLVEWFKGGFWINGFTNGAKWNIHIVHNSLTVIGNIHENPELLEDK